MNRTLCGVVLMFALAGCGGAATHAALGSSTSPSATKATSAVPSLTPTIPTTPVATVAQYASIIATYKATLGRDIATELGPKCSWVWPGHVDLVPGLVVCRFGALGVSWRAKAFGLDLSDASNPKASTYIGEIPGEIIDLVDATRRATEGVASAYPAVEPCMSKAGPGCQSALFEFYSAMTTMQTEFAAWSPYL